MQNRHHRDIQGFTLIELLVVVAIIVALIAILLPSLNRAVMVAEMAACGSNVKQLYLAHLNYAADYQGVNAHSNDYIGKDEPDYPSGSVFIQGGYMSESVDVFMCPGDDGSRTDFRALLPAGHSYGRNREAAKQTSHTNVRMTQIARPGDTPLLMEEHKDSPLNDGFFVASMLDNITLRHFDTGNLVYFDGHVSTSDSVVYNNLPPLLRREILDPTYPY